MKSVKNIRTSYKQSQRIWLNYFNERLLEKELITLSEYRCIREKILQEYSEKKTAINSYQS